MRHRMFTVYDCKAEAYLMPFFFQTRGQAIRVFTDMVNDPNHAFFKHPEDYTLFDLGVYEDTTSTFDLEGTPVAIGVAIEFKTQRQANLGLRLADTGGGV